MKTTLPLLFCFFYTLTFGQVNLNQGLIAYYPFSGNSNDNSSIGNHGNVFGATLTNDRFGNENSAYFFDGIDDFIEIIPVSDVSAIGDFSIALWVYCYEWEIQSPVDNTIDRQYIFEGASNTNTAESDFYRDGFRIMFDYSPSYEEKLHNTILYDYSNMTNNYLATNTTMNLSGDWHFILFSREGDQDVTYFDGKQIESTYSLNVKKSDILNMQHPWYIGSGFGNNPNYPDDRNYNFKGKIDDIRIYNRALNEDEIHVLNTSADYTIWTESIEVFDTIFQLPIYTSHVTKENNISAYQFDLVYDEDILEFVDIESTGTMSERGSIDFNDSMEGLLKVSYITSDTLYGDSLLLNVQFKAIDMGTSNINITNFLYNTDSVYNINSNSQVTVSKYGDVDGNMYVQAFDGSLVLKHTVGLDPLPGIDPLPWESWRFASADVDISSDITALDASYILQYTTGKINEFPIASMKKGVPLASDSIIVKVENGSINFYASENLFGFNVFIEKTSQIEFEEPVIDDHFAFATNIDGSDYNIALATAYAVEEGNKILEVPFVANENVTLPIDLIVNKEYKTVELTIETVTSSNTLSKIEKGIEFYPNPAHDIIEIKGLQGDSEISVYSITGAQLLYSEASNTTHSMDLSSLKKGVYIVNISDNRGGFIEKIVKK